MKNNRYTYKLLNLDVPMEGYFNKIFSTELVKKLIASSIIQEKLNTKSFFCVFLTHEQIYSYGPELDMFDICAGVEKIYIEDSQLKIDIKVLDTPNGRILEELLDNQPNLVKCLPVFVGENDHQNPEVITSCELENIYFTKVEND